MASMWRRAMVYLGLQDDEPEYGGEYESYRDYGDAGRRAAIPDRRRRRRRPRSAVTTANRTPSAPGAARAPRRRPPTGARAAARTVAAATTRCRPPAPRPSVVPHDRPDHRGARPRRRAAGLQRRPGGRRPAQGEPAGDPQPPGPAARAAAPPDRLLERPRLRGGRLDAAGRRPGLPAHAQRRRGLPGGEGAAAGAGPVPGLSRGRRPRAALLTVYLVVLAGGRCSRGSRSGRARSSPALNSLLFDLTEPVLRPVRRVIPPAGMFDMSFIVVFFALDDPAVGCSPSRLTSGSTACRFAAVLATMASHGCDPAGTPRQRDQGSVARLPPRRGRRAPRARRGHDRGPEPEAAGRASRSARPRRRPGSMCHCRRAATTPRCCSARCCSRSAPPTTRSNEAQAGPAS